MADVNTFIDDLGNDVTQRYVPKVEGFIHKLSEEIAADAAPKVEALVKDIIASQSDAVRDFLKELIKDLAARYHPQVSGNLTTRIVENGIEIVSTDTRLDIKDGQSNTVITSLDVPISVKIDLKQFLVKINTAGGEIRNLKV